MDKDGLAFVLGPGTRSCATWTDDANKRGDKGAFFSEMGWVDGFLSAYNAYEWRGKNISSETDLAARTAWLNNYCAANPTVNISAAADALVKFLAIGPHPNDK